jgi:hypothetical protein
MTPTEQKVANFREAEALEDNEDVDKEDVYAGRNNVISTLDEL